MYDIIIIFLIKIQNYTNHPLSSSGGGGGMKSKSLIFNLIHSEKDEPKKRKPIFYADFLRFWTHVG